MSANTRFWLAALLFCVGVWAIILYGLLVVA